MLRKILIGIGATIALLPYLGFPSSWDTVMFTVLGVAIVFLLTASQRGRVHHDTKEEKTETPTSKSGSRALHVKRSEVEDYPLMHVEKETTLDTELISDSPDEDTVVEKKVTVVHTRRRKMNADSLLTGGS